MVVFRNRGTMLPEEPALFCGPLKPETYERARQAAPGWDVYVIEQEWRDWMSEPPQHPDAAFVKFCEKWFARRGRPWALSDHS
jgi:hypothetical protein